MDDPPESIIGQMLPRAAASLLFLATAAFPQLGTTPGHPVYLWREGGFTVAQEMREAFASVGITGVDASGIPGIPSAVLSGLPFYVDQAVPPGFLALRPATFSAARDAYRNQPGRSSLRRHPCFRDPAAIRAAEAALGDALDLLGSARPDFVSLGDECGVTRATSPLDTCFCEHCLTALPAFLTARWGTLAAARNAWGPRWPADSRPSPPTTDEARTAFAADSEDAQRATVVAWNDFRAFTDLGFLDAAAGLLAACKHRRPEIPVGLLGGTMPSAFGGNDWERLAPQCDVLEIYDHGAARALAGSFAGPNTRFLHTLVADGRDPFVLRAALWRKVLRGDAATVLFWSRDWCVDGDPSKPSPLLKTLAADLKSLQDPAWRAWRAARPEPADVLLWYSSDSIRVNWLAETQKDGASWFERLASYEQARNRDALTREAWVAICEDLGLGFKFVDGMRFRNESGSAEGASVLVLARTTALSDPDAKEIESFGRRKLVLADARTGVLGPRLEPRSVGALDRAFGIRRSHTGFAALKTPADDDAALESPLAEPGITAVDSFPERRTVGGDGRFVQRARGTRSVYLNEELCNYVADRLQRPDRADAVRRALRPHLASVLARRKVKVERTSDSPPWPVAVHLRENGADLLCAIEANPVTGDRDIDWGPVKARPQVRVRVRFQGMHQVHDLRLGKDLGELSNIEVVTEVGSPVLLRLRKL